ncbi:unnamed protein product [Heterosigma akashiwo]
MGSYRKLYVDVLNYSSRFLMVGNELTDHWHVVDEEPVANVQRFLDAARASSYEITVFIDSIGRMNNAEERETWRERREKEVRDQRKGAVYGMGVLLGELFKDLGCRVCFCADAGGDDTIASFAEEDDADILSNDNDFVLYQGSSFEVFSDFEIEDGCLRLFKKNYRFLDNHAGPWKTLLPSKPNVSSTSPEVDEALKTCYYARGVPSYLSKVAENPHITARPLRQALYSKLGATEPILEEFPNWDPVSNRVVWDEAVVEADPSLVDLLDDPLEAVAQVFPDLGELLDSLNDVDKCNHLYAVSAVCFDLCARSKEDTPLLEHLCTFGPIIMDKFGVDRSAIDFSGTPTEPIAHVFHCRLCSAKVEMEEREVLWFNEKGFDLPRKCKTCRRRK